MIAPIGRPAKRPNHGVRDALRNLDERELVGDLDRADVARIETGFVRDRAD